MSQPLHTARRLARRVARPLAGRARAALAQRRTSASRVRELTEKERVRQKRQLRRAERRERLREMDLTELAAHFGTDKWGVHRYTPHYQRHLEHLRGDAFTLLEIGVGGYSRKRQGGASLRMWRWFFPQARIIGLDIQDKSFVDRGPIRTVQGDQTDEAVLRRIIEEEGVPLVVIDDGSHVPAHIRRTFEILFPLLPDGAVYAIEDTQTSYWPEWGGEEDPRARGTTMDLVKDLVDGLNHMELVVDHEPSYTDQWVRSVHCYHNLVVIEKGDNREGTQKERILAERYADRPGAGA